MCHNQSHVTQIIVSKLFDYSHCIGMYSQSGQGFWTPQDFVLGKDGRVYVLSRGVAQLGQRVSKINLDSEFQGQFGSCGDGQEHVENRRAPDHRGRFARKPRNRLVAPEREPR